MPSVPVNPFGAFPYVVVNNQTGSDTEASGAGPETALFGTAAATAASTVVTLLVDNPDLSGVLTDGSAVIWIDSSSGRQFSAITGVNNTAGVKTVTVESAYANTEAGKNWGIGGKRATLASSLRLGLDYLPGWVIDVEETGTDYTMTVPFKCSVTLIDFPAMLTSSSATRPIIKTATNSIDSLIDLTSCIHFTISNIYFKYTGSGGAVRGIAALTAAANYIFIHNCIVDGFHNGVDDENTTFWTLQSHKLSQCEVKNCTNYGYVCATSCNVDKCYFHDNAVGGILIRITNGVAVVTDTIVDSCGTSGHGNLEINTANTAVSVIRCDLTNSPAGSGFVISGATSSQGILLIDSIIYGNAQYGVDLKSSPNYLELIEQNCAYGGNSTADRRGFEAGSGAIDLSGDPFVSATDFGLNSTAGAGASCKSVGSNPPNATANSAPDIGAIASGGGGTDSGGATAYAF